MFVAFTARLKPCPDTYSGLKPVVFAGGEGFGYFARNERPRERLDRNRVFPGA